MSENAWKVGEKGTHDAYLEEFTVLAVDGSYLAVSSAYTRFWVHYAQLNCIRTQEQIEAEEQEKEQAALMRELTLGGFEGPALKKVVEHVILAGYRKQGEAK